MANYITNDELAEAVQACQTNGNAPTVNFCDCVRRIADHLLESPNFRRYSKQMKEDMASAALEKAIKSIRLLRVGANLFGYLTRVCYTSFQGELGKHYRFENLKRAARLRGCNELERLGMGATAQSIRQHERWENTTHQLDGTTKGHHRRRAKNAHAV